nr:hypothetical protein [Tanacetum cinerariifolium]
HGSQTLIPNVSHAPSFVIMLVGVVVAGHEHIAFGVDGSSWLKSARILAGQHVLLLAAMEGFRYRFHTHMPEPSYERVCQWTTPWRSLMDTCNSSGGDSEAREMRLANAPFVDDRMPFYSEKKS